MKKLLMLSAFFAMASATLFGQVELGMGYVNSQPQGLMGTKINSIHAFQFDLLYNVANTGLAGGMEFSFGGYGTEKSEQLYEFDNQTSMLAPVQVKNNVFSTGLVLRYEFLKDVALSPYIVGRAGLSRFNTNLYIDDPREEHTDECPVALVDESLASDVSFTSGIGGGLRLDLGSLFKGLGRDVIMLDFSANYTKGSIVEYMNVNEPTDGFVTGTNVESVDFQFANRAHPEVVNEYHTGYLYRTPLELMNYRIGVTFML